MQGKIDEVPAEAPAILPCSLERTGPGGPRGAGGVAETGVTPDALVDDPVLAHPVFFHDFPQGECLVISLTPPDDEFAEGVRRVASGIGARASG